MDSNIWLFSLPNTVHTILVYPLEDRCRSLHASSSSEGCELLLYHLNDLNLLTFELGKEVTNGTNWTKLVAEVTSWLEISIKTNKLTLCKPWRLTVTSTCDVHSNISAVCDVLLYSYNFTILIVYVEYEFIVQFRSECVSWQRLKKLLWRNWTCWVLWLTWKSWEILYIKCHDCIKFKVNKYGIFYRPMRMTTFLVVLNKCITT